jgi:hypothetical protein
MPKRTILFSYYTEADGTIHNRHDEVELSDEEAKRGDSLGAFVESEDVRESSVTAAHGDESGRPGKLGGVHTAMGSPAPERKSAAKPKPADKAKS